MTPLVVTLLLAAPIEQATTADVYAHSPSFAEEPGRMLKELKPKFMQHYHPDKEYNQKHGPAWSEIADALYKAAGDLHDYYQEKVQALESHNLD